MDVMEYISLFLGDRKWILHQGLSGPIQEVRKFSTGNAFGQIKVETKTIAYYITFSVDGMTREQEREFICALNENIDAYKVVMM